MCVGIPLHRSVVRSARSVAGNPRRHCLRPRSGRGRPHPGTGTALQQPAGQRRGPQCQRAAPRLTGPPRCRRAVLRGPAQGPGHGRHVPTEDSEHRAGPPHLPRHVGSHAAQGPGAPRGHLAAGGRRGHPIRHHRPSRPGRGDDVHPPRPGGQRRSLHAHHIRRGPVLSRHPHRGRRSQRNPAPASRRGSRPRHARHVHAPGHQLAAHSRDRRAGVPHPCRRCAVRHRGPEHPRAPVVGRTPGGLPARSARLCLAEWAEARAHAAGRARGEAEQQGRH